MNFFDRRKAEKLLRKYNPKDIYSRESFLEFKKRFNKINIDADFFRMMTEFEKAEMLKNAIKYNDIELVKSVAEYIKPLKFGDGTFQRENGIYFFNEMIKNPNREIIDVVSKFIINNRQNGWENFNNTNFMTTDFTNVDVDTFKILENSGIISGNEPSLLHGVVKWRNLELVKYLVEVKGRDVNEILLLNNDPGSKISETPLYTASRDSYKSEVYDYLVKKGANPMWKDPYYGRTCEETLQEFSDYKVLTSENALNKIKSEIGESNLNIDQLNELSDYINELSASSSHGI